MIFLIFKLGVRPYCRSMLLPDLIVFGSTFTYIDFPEKIPSVTLNVFFFFFLKAFPEV